MLSEIHGRLDKHVLALTFSLLDHYLYRSRLTSSTGNVGQTPTVVGPDTRSDFKITLWRGAQVNLVQLHKLKDFLPCYIIQRAVELSAPPVKNTSF